VQADFEVCLAADIYCLARFDIILGFWVVHLGPTNPLDLHPICSRACQDGQNKRRHVKYLRTDKSAWAVRRGVNREADTWIMQGSPTTPLESTEEVVSRAL
jgi:hypothetical protein